MNRKGLTRTLLLVPICMAAFLLLVVLGAPEPVALLPFFIGIGVAIYWFLTVEKRT